MKTRPVVSVVIPTYNRVADLRRALASLRQQTFEDWQAIIVDNHSQDGTREAVEALNDPRLQFLQVHNRGVVAFSRNAGIEAATGEFVAFLDSDDWWAPTKLTRSVERLRAGADFTYHDLYLVRSANQKLFWKKAHTRPLRPPVFQDLLIGSNAIATSSVVTRRQMLIDAGGFTEELEWIGWEDFDTWLRIGLLTERFDRIEEPLGYYWFGGGNVSTPQRLLTNIEAFRKKYADRPGAPLATLPGVYHYLMGRGYYMTGALEKVGPEMRRASAAGMPAFLQVKARCWTLLAMFRRSTRQA
jgi:teichuronic acid biosynthesis glycosyltransferase TuaG